MPGERYHPVEETQPATRESIKKLNSVLTRLKNTPPKNLDVTETAKLYSSQLGQKLLADEQENGITHTLYSISNGEGERNHHLFFSLGNDRFPGTIMLQTDKVTRYEIHEDRVYQYSHTDTRSVEEKRKKEEESRMHGFDLMTEAELKDLNTTLARLNT